MHTLLTACLCSIAPNTQLRVGLLVLSRGLALGKKDAL
jgi:hypothetical protein